jgi:DNA polymerase III epsilon subunit-like protein
MHTQNLAFIDTETTGLDIEKHEIIQLGCVVVSQTPGASNGEVYDIVEEFELKIKPARIEDADKTALRINGYNEADWVLGYTLAEAMQIFANKTKDAIMVGHNLPFDFAFITKAFATTGVENKMHYHKLDTISIAFAKAKKRDDINRFSLRSLCEVFKIENTRAHTALADARATFELYKRLMAL